MSRDDRGLILSASGEIGGVIGEFAAGFYAANLKDFRQFYLTYAHFEKSYSLRSQLGLSHYCERFTHDMHCASPEMKDFRLISGKIRSPDAEKQVEAAV